MAARQRRSWLTFLLLFVLGVPMSGGGIYFLFEKWERRAQFQAGVPGELLDYDGQVKEQGKLGVTLIYGYDLQIVYRDSTGTERRGPVDFDLFWNPANPEEWTLRHDPADPSRFVVSGEVTGWEPWGVPAFVLMMGAFMAAGAFLTLREARRRRELLARVANESEEVLCELVSHSLNEKAHVVEYKVAGDRTRKETLEGEPLIVEHEGTAFLIALRSPAAPAELVVLLKDFSPFLVENVASAA